MNSNNENVLISELLTRDVISVSENKTINNAIKLLAENNIGALPVLNNSMELCGIISERDIIREMSKNIVVNFKKSFINSIMTSKVITIDKNKKSEDIMEIMSKNKIRHIPIVEKKLLTSVAKVEVLNQTLKEMHIYIGQVNQLLTQFPEIYPLI